MEKGALKPNLIRYAETSMKTGLGLKYIYEYLGVPFLQLMVMCVMLIFIILTFILDGSIKKTT